MRAVSNERIVCRGCNQTKGDLTPREWERFKEATPRWWAQSPGYWLRLRAKARNGGLAEALAGVRA